ncbi:hypothetical protein KKH23_06295 [Patescibacteria group bacterium]|nr:hypothetical protein [Patescibacteria group bacterium]
MATRHEIFAGLDLIVNTNRINDEVWLGLIPLLKGIDIKTEQPFSPIIEVITRQGNKITKIPRFQFIQEEAIKSSEISLGLCNRINIVLEKTNHIPLSNGTDYFRVKMSDIISDVSDTTSMLLNENSLIKEADKEAKLSNISKKYKTHVPKLKHKISIKNMSEEFRFLNILNDLLDAMSYELKNLRSTDGGQATMNIDEIKKLIWQRITTARVYLSHLSGDEVELMRTVIFDIERNLQGINSYAELEALGNYIDSNTTKLVMIRRWWAL